MRDPVLTPHTRPGQQLAVTTLGRAWGKNVMLR